VFFAVLQELYRICTNGAFIYIEVPHPNHKYQIIDFTHQRPIHIEGLRLLDRQYCKKLISVGSSRSPLAIMYNINFTIVDYNVRLDQDFVKHITNVLGSFDESKIPSYTHLFNNIQATQVITLKCVK